MKRKKENRMSYAVISDIHIDINKDCEIVTQLIEHVSKSVARALLIAGDISDEYQKTIESVATIKKQLGIPVYYVPGNHDMWSENFEKTSTQNIYDAFCHDSNYLLHGSVQLDEDTTLIGDIGWYDYSFGSSKFSIEEFERMNYLDRTWQDKIRNQWTNDNKATNERALKRLEEQLQQVKTKRIIVMTHMVPIEEFTVTNPNEMWQYFNAFIGSKKLHELYRKYHVTYAICGHIHYRKRIIKDGITYLCPCLNYASEWEEKDSGKEIMKAMQWIE